MADDAAGVGTAQSSLRRARVFDGRKEDGSPLVQRQALNSVDEIMRIVDYLKAAPTVLFGRGLDPDAWAPEQPPAVPRTFSTDGTWIWSGALTYYVQKYGMPPELDLLNHIRARNYTAPDVSADVRAAATAQLLDR
jgi:hypothetical protein